APSATRPAPPAYEPSIPATCLDAGPSPSSITRHGATVARTSAEDSLREMVQVVAPDLEVVTTACMHVPEVGHLVRSKIVVRAPADGEEIVLIATRHPQQLQHLSRLRRVGHQRLRLARVRRRGEAPDPGEPVE